jgi:hypothetical protein
MTRSTAKTTSTAPQATTLPTQEKQLSTSKNYAFKKTGCTIVYEKYSEGRRTSD